MVNTKAMVTTGLLVRAKAIETDGEVLLTTFSNPNDEAFAASLA